MIVQIIKVIATKLPTTVVKILESKKYFNTKVIVTDCDVFVSSENAAHLERMLASVINIEDVYLESYSRKEKSFLLKVY